MARGTGCVPLTHATDTGWAWVVLAAVFCSWTLLGFGYSNGVLNVLFLEEFGKSKQMTAWICSTQSALWSLTAPIGTLVINRHGVRVAGVLAGFLGSLGFLLTYFAWSFTWALFSFGVMVGTSFGISFMCIQVIIGRYFDKYRNLAYGIANTAIGSGTFLCPLVMNYCIEKYGWRGCMLILSGIYLNTVACAALYRPAPKIRITCDVTAKESKANRIDPEKRPEETPQKSDKTECLEMGLYDHPTETSAAEIANESDMMLQKSPIPNEANSENDSTLPAVKIQVENTDRKAKKKPTIIFWRNIATTVKTLSTFCDSRFTAVCFSMLFVSAAIFLTYVHFPAYFIRQGASLAEVSTLLAVVGIFNIFCRLLGGVATNHPDMDVILFHLASSGITSIILLICPSLAPYRNGRLVFAAMFGFYGNWNYSLMSPLLIKLFGLESLPITAGMALFVCGLGSFIGPPFAGWLYDVTGTYIYSFYLAGTLYMFGAIAIMFTNVGYRPGSSNPEE